MAVIRKKQCRVCKKWKLATTENFYKRPEASDGLRADCIDCKINKSSKDYMNRKDI